MIYQFYMGITIAAVCFMPNVVNAATVTDLQFKPTTISVARHFTLHTARVVAKDPWSGVETTWIPINVIKKTLREVGIVTKWNRLGTSFTLVTYPPGNTKAALGDPEALPASPNEIQYNLVAGAPPSGDMPKLVAKDPLTCTNTVYMPIWYLNHEILNHYWNMRSIWNGITNVWSLDFTPFIWTENTGK